MRLLVVLLVAFIAACCEPALNPLNSAEQAEFKTVAMVKVDDEYNAKTYCSGVWLSDKVFITAYHCVRDEDEVQYVAFGEFSLGKLIVRDATVYATDDVNDLALVRVTGEAPEHLVARLAWTARVGEDLDIVGHPVGIMWSYIHGYVSQSRFGESGVGKVMTDVIQVSAPVFFGDSGGGAFNKRGELVGICSWLTRVPNTGYYIRFNVVREFIYKNGV